MVPDHPPRYHRQMKKVRHRQIIPFFLFLPWFQLQEYQDPHLILILALQDVNNISKHEDFVKTSSF